MLSVWLINPFARSYHKCVTDKSYTTMMSVLYLGHPRYHWIGLNPAFIWYSVCCNNIEVEVEHMWDSMIFDMIRYVSQIIIGF